MSLVGLVLAAAALADCESLAVRGDEGATACYREFARTTDRFPLQAEALWRAGDVAGANAAFRDALAAEPDSAAIRSRWGRLFLDVHQDADAEALFGEALKLDGNDVDALLGMAQLSLGRFDPGVRSHAERVLALDPDNPQAHLLLASAGLELGEVDTVRQRLTGLLERDVFQGFFELEAFALLAAADALEDRLPSPWVERALAINPRFGTVHAVPAHHYVITRRYREAVARYQQAVEVQPQLWDAHAELGINLLRVDRNDEARQHLQQAYEGDPYNALTVNTLRLLDLRDDFAVRSADGLVMRAPAGQADALFPYVSRLTAQARREMAGRYGYRPTDPVVVELFEHHDDFAVRTAGLPGLGILGATFGDVVVMDGPAANGIDDGFDWASALWHELGHVYTLGATDNRVSRWFSEGVSVMEEWDHGPTRTRSVPVSFLTALAEQRLLGVAELDEGFLRPRYPEQVGVSYVQAGLLCQLIARDHEGGLGRMLEAYRQGADTATAVRRGLELEPAVLDAAFADYLETRFGTVVDQLDTLERALADTHQAAGDENWTGALAAGRRAVELFPAYVQPDSAYVPLARAAEALGDSALLDTTLRGYFEHGGRDPWALLQLAERHRAEGEAAAELSVWQAVVRTLPLDGDLHRRFGERLTALDRPADALLEFELALALGPHDQAGARLQLAQTYFALGRLTEARRAVLETLETAPRYAAALDLLLQINDEEAPR